MPKKPPSSQRSSSTKAKKPAPRAQLNSTPRVDPKTSNDPNNEPENLLTRRRQQLILNIFRDALSETLAAPDFQATLQQVKKALFDRDFDGAFNSEPHLHAYAARWSPTRALCYASVLERIRSHLDGVIGPNQQDADLEDSPKVLRVVAVGGAAAETVAFGAFLGEQSSSVRGEITLVDIAPWAEVVRLLHTGLVTPPPISKYASAAAKEGAVPMVSPEERLVATFQQHDILALERDALAAILRGPSEGHAPLLVMINFTLNELFTAGGIGRTTTFLLRLSACMPPGSLLLVLDSPGSYSETAVGAAQTANAAVEKKKYPMQWLLHKVLSSTEDVTWTWLEMHDSIWFRLPEGLDYPIPLENMRFQMHLYRADAAPRINSG